MIECRQLRFQYPGESDSSNELVFETIQIEAGERVALVGPSGCGKTTLINLIAGVLVPDSGFVRVNESEVSALSLNERQAFRLAHFGLIPQNFELLDYLTVQENILMPLRLAENGVVSSDDLARANELAHRSEIGHLLKKFPSDISKGEQQRVAICRGLIREPTWILADEPTGNLDPSTQGRVIDLLLESAAAIDAGVIMITHEPSLHSRFDRILDFLEIRQGLRDC